ncbi:MAG: NADH-quinone oxidoreductase subunit M [Bacteroidota bacterium]|nr:NADH-quinone oxidoreductase subunit M [Bacteroidota bacterium]
MLTISLILLPLIVSVLLFFMKGQKASQQIALLATLAELAIALIAFTGFDKSLAVNYPLLIDWLPKMGFSFSLGMDGISLLLVMLTAVLTPFIILSTFNRENKLPASFYALVLMMQAALVGVFTSQDGLLFYVFWELALIPIYFICGLWGGENKVQITLKFFIYTMVGSLFMLAALIWLYTKTPAPHQFGIKNLLLVIPTLSPVEQAWLFAAFVLAFAIKMPLFPFHSWQPDTYTVAPPAGSMLLAGIMLKMGIYGLLRFVLPFRGNTLSTYGPVVIVLALIGLIYGSIIAIKQQEIKRLIAYSSFAHVGLMAAAAFALTRDALAGTIFQMLSHGVNIVALFFVADIIQRRTNTTQISELGGIAKQAPRFAVFFMIAMLGSVALPLTNGFIGEFLMLVGLAQYSMAVAAVAGISIILGAVYMFWLYQRTMYGETKPASESFTDLTSTEMLVAVPLIILIVVMGVYPKPLLEIAQPAITEILKYIH